MRATQEQQHQIGEKALAGVVWAAHILSYLSAESFLRKEAILGLFADGKSLLGAVCSWERLAREEKGRRRISVE